MNTKTATKTAISIFLITLAAWATAAADTIPVSVSVTDGSVESLSAYQANETTFRATFTSNDSPINVTGRNPFMYWAASPHTRQIVTASVEIVSAGGGIVDFIFSPRDLNISNGIASAIYGIGMKTGPQTLKQGAFAIYPDAAMSGVDPVVYTTNVNWGLINWVGLPNYIEEDAGVDGLFVRQSNAWYDISGRFLELMTSKVSYVAHQTSMASKVDAQLFASSTQEIWSAIESTASGSASNWSSFVALENPNIGGKNITNVTGIADIEWISGQLTISGTATFASAPIMPGYPTSAQFGDSLAAMSNTIGSVSNALNLRLASQETGTPTRIEWASTNLGLQSQIALLLPISTYASATASLWSSHTTLDTGKVALSVFNATNAGLQAQISARTLSSIYEASTALLWSAISSRATISETFTGLVTQGSALLSASNQSRTIYLTIDLSGFATNNQWNGTASNAALTIYASNPSGYVSSAQVALQIASNVNGFVTEVTATGFVRKVDYYAGVLAAQLLLTNSTSGNTILIQPSASTPSISFASQYGSASITFPAASLGGGTNHFSLSSKGITNVSDIYASGEIRAQSFSGSFPGMATSAQWNASVAGASNLAWSIGEGASNLARSVHASVSNSFLSITGGTMQGSINLDERTMFAANIITSLYDTAIQFDGGNFLGKWTFITQPDIIGYVPTNGNAAGLTNFPATVASSSSLLSHSSTLSNFVLAVSNTLNAKIDASGAAGTNLHNSQGVLVTNLQASVSALSNSLIATMAASTNAQQLGSNAVPWSAFTNAVLATAPNFSSETATQSLNMAGLGFTNVTMIRAPATTFGTPPTNLFIFAPNGGANGRIVFGPVNTPITQEGGLLLTSTNSLEPVTIKGADTFSSGGAGGSVAISGGLGASGTSNGQVVIRGNIIIGAPYDGAYPFTNSTVTILNANLYGNAGNLTNFPASLQTVTAFNNWSTNVPKIVMGTVLSNTSHNVGNLVVGTTNFWIWSPNGGGPGTNYFRGTGTWSFP